MADQISGPPPLASPPGTPVASPTGPTFAGLAGTPMSPPTTPGGSEVASVAIRVSMEIDMALKSLAQAIPSIAPWVQKTVSELKMELARALEQGVPTSPAPTGTNESFPGGAGLL